MSSKSWAFGCSFVLLAGLLFLSIPSDSSSFGAQPTKKSGREEEEEPQDKTKTPKKIEDVDPKSPTEAPRQPPPPTKFDIASEASKAKNAHAREFLRRVSIPYDQMVSVGGNTTRISVFPTRKLPEERFTVVFLDAQLSPGKERDFPTGAGFTLQPFEEIVIEEVDSFLRRRTDGLLDDAKQELAAQVLQATRRFHAAALEQRKRIGKEWDAVDLQLRRRIVQIRRDQLRKAIESKDYYKADNLSLELTGYTDDVEAMKDIYRLLLQKEMDSANPDKDEDYLKIRDALNQFENIAGGRGDVAAISARKRLRERASSYVQEAKRMAEANQNAGAFNRLRMADALDPDFAEIQKLRGQLRDRILYVGVSRLPDNLSPLTARLDSELLGVDLIFESLLEVIPDPELGRRYHPVLAESMPTMTPLGREFVLRRSALWSNEAGMAVNAHDIHGTIDLLRRFPHHRAFEGLEVLDTDKARVDDPFKFRLAYKQGVLEPLNRATFKVMPARYLKASSKGADDDAFARKPIGSGPYRYEGREKESGGREVAVFRANPYYGQRPGYFGLPNIREIRMAVPQISSAPTQVADGQLHLVLDVSTPDLARYTSDPHAGGLSKVFTPTNNRRIWMLAVNHRNQPMQNVELRRGIAAAIDREDILNTIYRTPDIRNVHRAMTGPFPPNSWATPAIAREKGVGLTNKDLAGGLLSAAAARGNARLKLCYDASDPLAVRACGKMKEQIEGAAGKSGTRASIEIELKPIAGENFMRMLMDEHDFDLAYCSFDYKDDLYWLGGLLDRRAGGRGERNFLGYLAEGSNAQLDDNDLRLTIEDVRAHRDFKDKYRELTWKVHKKFNDRMPFVPLWQIDRHMIVHNLLETYWDSASEKVRPDRIDPASVFTGVQLWRLK